MSRKEERTIHRRSAGIEQTAHYDRALPATQQSITSADLLVYHIFSQSFFYFPPLFQNESHAHMFDSGDNQWAANKKQQKEVEREIEGEIEEGRDGGMEETVLEQHNKSGRVEMGEG